MRKVSAAVRGEEQTLKPTVAACSQARAWKEKSVQRDGPSTAAGFKPLPTQAEAELKVERCGS